MQNNINFNTNFQTGDNVVNIGNQSRILDEHNKKQLEENLEKDKKIIITSVLGDGEAFNFATQIKDYLLSAGYQAEGVNQAVYSSPVMGQGIQKNNDGYNIVIGSKQN